MTYRLIFELVIFLMPFAAFGLYRLARQEALEDGKKPWPITVLFILGAVLAIGAWVVLIFLDRGSGETCYERKRLVDGQMVGGQEIPCEKKKSDLGLPASRDPGGSADGLGVDNPIINRTPPPLDDQIPEDPPE